MIQVADLRATANHRFCRSADGPSRNHLISQLVRAHVICLVYSIAEPSTFERVAEYWLPLFRREGVNVSAGLLVREIVLIQLSAQVPVILVGNKIDLRGGAVTNEALEEEIAPLMRDFKVSESVNFRKTTLIRSFYRKSKP